MITPARVDFGRMVFGRPEEQPDPDVPRGQLAKTTLRRAAMLHEAKDLLAVLPGPNETLYGLLLARVDFLVLVAALLEQLGPCAVMRAATLSFNARNVGELLRMVDGRTVGRLTLLCSLFFKDHSPACYTTLADALAARPGGHRLGAARTHAKIICLSFADGRRFVLEGSPNLRKNGNVEQFTLFDSAVIHDFFADWIDTTVAKFVPDAPSG